MGPSENALLISLRIAGDRYVNIWKSREIIQFRKLVFFPNNKERIE